MVSKTEFLDVRSFNFFFLCVFVLDVQGLQTRLPDGDCRSAEGPRPDTSWPPVCGTGVTPDTGYRGLHGLETHQKQDIEVCTD